MELTRLKPDQSKSEGVPDRAKLTSAPFVTVAPQPLSFNHAHSPAVRLGYGFEPSYAPATNGLQAKLTINEPGDQYEQEADRVAEQVMRMPDPAVRLQRKCGCGGLPSSGQFCEECASQTAPLQRAAVANSQSVGVAPPTVHAVLSSRGQPLDATTRAFMEPRFQFDFKHVRVHTDAQAENASSAVGAHAFTVGRSIAFGLGQYQPGTSQGKRLLAHELAHVVQQDGRSGLVQRAAPAVAIGGAVVAVEVILFWIAFVLSAIAAAYLLIQAYEWARANGLGIQAALQALMRGGSKLLDGARKTVKAVNDLLERAARIPRKSPGCAEAIQQLSVRIVQFELLLVDLVAEFAAPVPHLSVVRPLVQEMEALLPEIGFWSGRVVAECAL